MSANAGPRSGAQPLKKSEKDRRRLRLALLIALVVATVVIADPGGLLGGSELQSLDMRHRIFARKTPITDRIVIIDIDEQSIKDLEPVYGRFPWPRAVHGELVAYLSRCGARAIGFDVTFSERTRRVDLDQNSIDDLQELARETATPRQQDDLRNRLASLDPASSDNYFAAEAARSQRVFHSATFLAPDPAPLADSATFTRIRDALSRFAIPGPFSGYPLPVYQGATLPLEALMATSRGVGHINFDPDPDGPCRRSTPLIGFRDRSVAYPSFPVVMAACLKGVELSAIRASENGVRIGDVEMPVDRNGGSMVRFQGGEFTQDATGRNVFTSYYRRIPYAEVLAEIDAVGRGEKAWLPTDAFRDKIVLVGSTAAGLLDLRVTPFQAVSPGVEIHANILDNILSNRFLRRPPVPCESLFVLLAALSVAWITARSRPWTGFATSIGMMTVAVTGSFLLFEEGWVMPVVAPCVAALFAYAGVVLFRYMTEEREKREIRAAFGHYLAPAVLEAVLMDPARLALGGERRRVSVLVSDVAGFTELSETMQPELVHAMLTEYLTKMVECVIATGGTLDKFIGDAVVAEWNAPVDQPDHAARACDCALRMMEALAKLNERWRTEGKPVLRIRIGANTGEMLVGNMGAESLFEYTAIGNEMNTAARLEPLNKDFGTEIVISEATWNEASAARPDGFFGRELARVEVKGRKTALTVYELVGRRESVSETRQRAMSAFQDGTALFNNRDFLTARARFRAALDAFDDDGPSLTYIRLCDEFLSNPPSPEWNGTYVQASK